ncbi:trichohyalin-like [Pectinophora gossypiella]|uniref:trichohyalin-like n=1 Tax=Pectinophora gossypiella TaxID=13191 RepID=UPI00214E6681|nr:trichohyalin-like [Pectinophora gossypiella]
MHNWRLLLLAFLAVLQPIASFTERNLVDGREQCCNRNSLLRDTRLSYGTLRHKLPEDRRLSRTDIREDRRYEVRNDDTVLTRPSADRRLVEFRSERDITSRLSPVRVARITRAEFRRERITDTRRERVSPAREDRERRSRDTFRIAFREINRDARYRDVARDSRRTDIRQNNRNSREFSYVRMSGDNNRVDQRFDSERKARNAEELRREIRRSREHSAEFRRIKETRETRDVLQRTRDDVARNEISRDMQDRRDVRERMEERRARSQSRLFENNRERRSLERRVREIDVRRSALGSRSVDRVLDRRAESSMARRESRDERLRINEQFDERREREANRQSRDRTIDVRRELRQRNQEERRDARQPDNRARIVENRNVRLERAGTRREARDDKREFRAVRGDERAYERRAESRRVTNSNRQTTEHIVLRETRRDIRGRSVDARQRDTSTDRADYRNAKNVERDLADARFRSTEYRTRENVNLVREKNQFDVQSSSMNWQYIFYTLQGIYLCGILTQILSQKHSDKKPRALSWLATPRSLIKVD